jgi:YfiH family protein
MDAKMETQRNLLNVRRFQNQYGSGKIFSLPGNSSRGLHFFGNKALDRSAIQSFFPHKELILLNQTHSNNVVNFMKDPTLPKTTWAGDASLSIAKDQVLIVKTADCVPILFMSDSLDVHGAIHAGWKGVANRIFIEFLKQLNMTQEIRGYFDFGPHITAKNFEVDRDVALEIMSSIVSDREECMLKLKENQMPEYFQLKGDKVHIHLVSILKEQLESAEAGLCLLSEELVEDVFDQSKYYSYRRDRGNTGRNLSLSLVFQEKDVNSMLQCFLPGSE